LKGNSGAGGNLLLTRPKDKKIGGVGDWRVALLRPQLPADTPLPENCQAATDT